MKKISILLLVIVAALTSCKKVPEVNLKYVDVERDLITVGTTTATIQCDYEYIATLKKAFLNYCEGADTTNMSVAEMSVVQKTLYVELSGLKENTTYSYYYEFANGFNSMRSAAKTFKTEASPVTPPEITPPTVVTAEVSEITSNSAQCGGEVTNDGGAEVTERGICWSTNGNPTLSDSHIAVGSGTGSFTYTLTGLTASTTYHVRAYATNVAGTAYGLDKTFTTLSGGGGSGEAPIGAINGLFTINENGDQVYFSQGNLQYQASTNTWRFADNQWDYVGEANANISPTYDGWIDLFGWGTSGWDNGNLYYQPYNYESDSTAVANGYGPANPHTFTCYDLFYPYENSDWGVYNAISNGGNEPRCWRTLGIWEWDYLLRVRTTPSGYLFVKATVNNVSGLILFPDNWDASIYSFNGINSTVLPFSQNIITIDNWITAEAGGAVFLPAAGYRDGTEVGWVGNGGYYWSRTHALDLHGYAEVLGFNPEQASARFLGQTRWGESVRLVQDSNK